jgi:hypothetical protein
MPGARPPAAVIVPGMVAPLPTILTEQLAAELLGTTVRRVRAWVRAGALPGATLPDGAVVVRLADLETWVESRRVTPEPKGSRDAAN